MPYRVCLWAVVAGLCAATAAHASGHAEISALPIGSFAIEKGWHDVNYPIAQAVRGAPKMSLVLIASRPYVEQPSLGPLSEEEANDPFAPPKGNLQVEGTVRIKAYGRDLPPWVLDPKRTAYVISFETIRNNPSFKSDHVALQVSLEGEAESVLVTLLSMPEFTMLGGDKAASFEGPLSSMIATIDDADAKAYFAALIDEVAGDVVKTRAAYEKLSESKNSEVARFARRGLRMIEYLTRPHKLTGNFVEHRRWGLYLQFGGYYGPAFAEFDENRVIDPSLTESQYRAGECLERIGGETLNVVHYFNRTGENTPFENPTIWSALVVIIRSRGAKTLTPEEIINVKDQFILLDRVLWAASNGAFRLGVSFFEIEKEEASTVTRHLQRVTGPPDDLIQKRGWYDLVYCVRPRVEGEERAHVETGWTDVGPNGAAIATFHTDAPFTAYLKSAYALLYASAQSAGATHGWPDPAHALDCGFQPSRFGSSAYRSALRYHLSPGDFERLGASDVPVDATYLKLWRIEGPVPVSTSDDAAPVEADWPASGVKTANLVADDDFIDLARRFPNAGAARIRATTWVFAPKEQRVWIRLGRNDRASLWLNGRRVIAAPSQSGGKFDGKNVVDTAFTRETLAAGWNEMNVVVAGRPTDKNKGWGFSVAVTTLDKQPVPGLACVYEQPKDRLAPRYTLPKAGGHFDWSSVKSDFRRQLPCLTDADLQSITGIADLRIRAGSELGAAFVALDSASRKSDATYRPTASWSGTASRDVVLNNLMDWSRESIAAIRFKTGAEARDMLLVRPEALLAATTILKESDSSDKLFGGKKPAERLLGWIDATPLGTVFVMEARLAGDAWPVDEEEILTPYGPFVPNWPDEFREGPPAPGSPPIPAG